MARSERITLQNVAATMMWLRQIYTVTRTFPQILHVKMQMLKLQCFNDEIATSNLQRLSNGNTVM